MKRDLKKIGRTLITFFPAAKEPADFLKRFLRILLRSSVEDDFDAVKLFPDRKDILLLDIGANRGAAVGVFLRNTRNCNVYCFEPNPDVFSKAHSRFRSNARVKLFNVGLGANEGTFKLFIPVYRGYAFDGLGSLSPEFDDSWLSEKLLFYDKKFLQIREVNCQIKRLDDLNLEPFFMKVDVQGAEFDVVQGSEATLRKCQPILLMESGQQDHAILRFAGQFGYKRYRYAKGKFFEGERGSPNSFFMTDEKYRLIVSRKSM
jgi:FkbM family methyltransferase